MSELPPLEQDLHALLEAESDGYPDDAAMRGRVLRRIETAVAFAVVAQTASVGTPPAATAPTATVGAAVSMKGAILGSVVAFAVGAGVGEWHARTASNVAGPAPAVSALGAPVSILTPTSVPQPLNLLDADPPGSTPPNLAPAPGPRAPDAAQSLAATATVHAVDTLAEEQMLIDTARAGLARGRATDTLRAADDHAMRFGSGKLAEERENLAIQALALLGRRNEATARAARFYKRYPGSLYRSSLDELLKLPSTADGGP
jgi:hypothetical protein